MEGDSGLAEGVQAATVGIETVTRTSENNLELGRNRDGEIGAGRHARRRLGDTGQYVVSEPSECRAEGDDVARKAAQRQEGHKQQEAQAGRSAPVVRTTG